MKRTLLYAALVLFAACHHAGAVEADADAVPKFPVLFAGEPLSADARYLAGWVVRHGDNQRMPFAIVDKKGARLFVFEADGRLRAATAVLVGAGPGDVSVPGIAGRAPASLLPQERITPAGRFVSEPGRNLKGEDIVWVDYDAKIAIHRLRPDAAREQRARWLATTSPDDNRVSLGCVVVPVAFYDSVIGPVFGRRYGVVYVLPEAQSVQAMLDALSAG